MRALTVRPGSEDPRVDHVPEPDPALGSVLVDRPLAGICRTDHDLLGRAYGEAPTGADRLVVCSQRWREDPGHLVRIDPALGGAGALVEPASVVAEAWQQVEQAGDRGQWRPRTALVTAAGPVGLLTRSVPLEGAVAALEPQEHDVEVVVELRPAGEGTS